MSSPAQPTPASPSPYDATDPIRMLYLGDSGSGKSGSLASLVAGGYNVYIADADKGASVLVGPRGWLQHPDSPYLKAKPGLWPQAAPAQLMARAHPIPVSETFTKVGGKMVPKGDGWNKLSDVLTNADPQPGKAFLGGWPGKGMIETWGPRDVLVLDSLSRASDFALYQQLVLAGHALSGPQQSDWWPPQRQVHQLLMTLCSSNVKCHIIVIGHIKYIEKDNGVTRGMPQTLGKALSPEIGQQFNHTLLAQSSGQGTGVKHKLMTRTTGVIDLKTSSPLGTKPEYDLETGLLEYFNSILGPLPPLPQAVTPAQS